MLQLPVGRDAGQTALNRNCPAEIGTVGNYVLKKGWMKLRLLFNSIRGIVHPDPPKTLNMSDVRWTCTHTMLVVQFSLP